MIYEARCSTCSHITTFQSPMSERHNTPPCEACNGDTTLKISGGVGFTPVYGAGDYPGYMCPVTDTFVDSRKKRNEIMAEHNLQPHSSADQAKHHTGF